MAVPGEGGGRRGGKKVSWKDAAPEPDLVWRAGSAGMFGGLQEGSLSLRGGGRD